MSLEHTKTIFRMPPHNQSGLSIIEVMLAVIILGTSAFWTLRGFTNISEYQEMTDSATLVYQTDQIVKKQLGRVLQETMRENIDISIGYVEQDDLGNDIKTERVEDLTTLLAERCNNFQISIEKATDNPTSTEEEKEELNRTSKYRFTTANYKYRGYDGEWVYYSYLSSYFTGAISRVSQKTRYNSDSGSYSTIDLNPPKNLVAAMERCRDYGTVDPNMNGKDTFYGCLYNSSENTFVEFKATLWDFHSGKPVACQNLHGVLGRGILATYQAYTYKENKQKTKLCTEKKGSCSNTFSVTSFGGSLSLPKIVFKRGLEYVSEKTAE